MNTTKKKILVLGVEGEIGTVLAGLLPDEGYDAKLSPSSWEPPFDEIFTELTAIKFEMVLISYWAFWPVLPELRRRFPEIKIMFLSSRDVKWGDEFAKPYGVEEVVQVPFDYDDLLSKVRKILL